MYARDVTTVIGPLQKTTQHGKARARAVGPHLSAASRSKMALASAKQLLDELMGRDRNLAPAEKKNTCNWEDPDVCKHFLAQFCPNDLFVNTKADLGPCNKVHDERLKREYEESSRYKQEGYEEGFLQFCQSMLSDVEKRIRRARQRLSLNNQEGGIKPREPSEPTDERVIVLNERIQGLLQQVEQLGCEGKVEEAQGVMKLCDQLKEERRALDKDSDTAHWLKQTAELAAAQEKQMEVCDICGAFLIVGDAQQRVDDHLMGKQHMGYAKLKEAVEEMVGKREKEREDKEKQREREREERRRRRDDDDSRSRRTDDKRDDRRDDKRDDKRDDRREDRREDKRDDKKDDKRRRRSRSRHRDDGDRRREDGDRRKDDADQRKRDEDRRKRDEDRRKEDGERRRSSRRSEERSRSHRDSSSHRSSGHDRHRRSDRREDSHHRDRSRDRGGGSSSSRVTNGDASPRHRDDK